MEPSVKVKVYKDPNADLITYEYKLSALYRSVSFEITPDALELSPKQTVFVRMICETNNKGVPLEDTFVAAGINHTDGKRDLVEWNPNIKRWQLTRRFIESGLELDIISSQSYTEVMGIFFDRLGIQHPLHAIEKALPEPDPFEIYGERYGAWS